jgi:hypothetical protein
MEGNGDVMNHTTLDTHISEAASKIAALKGKQCRLLALGKRDKTLA